MTTEPLISWLDDIRQITVILIYDYSMVVAVACWQPRALTWVLVSCSGLDGNPLGPVKCPDHHTLASAHL